VDERFVFDDPSYLALADQRAGEYRTASPFPHAVIEDFLPRAVAARALQAFPRAGDADWFSFDSGRERKLALARETQFPPAIRHLLHQFNSAPCLAFLEALTGVPALVPDPDFEGGGLHQIQPGGWLKIHADFNKHSRSGLDRRPNLLVYLNPSWREEYGGHLELWDREMQGCLRRIAPAFNRCVIFSTTDFAYHGHPDPVQSPPGVTRKSLALYYYSNGRPAEETSAPHTTVFKLRPGERLDSPSRLSARAVVRAVTPPVVLSVARLLQRRLGRGGRAD
jgi:Rps23 Pro-64 3,4-dihydroxylase Tpa1-like proline 4-hydroxylase